MGGSSNGLDVYETQEGYADTWDVGGSRYSFYANAAFDPQQYVGNTSAVPLALLSAPPTYATLDSAGGANGYGPSGAASRTAAGSPFNPSASPLPWMIGGVIVAVYLFHYLYYRERRRRG
jgi:hypothetical protein